MIRQIRIPDPAHMGTVQDEDGSEREVTVPFRDFVAVLLNHKRWQRDVASLRLSMQLQEAFDGCVADDVVDVSEEGWQGLRDALDPSQLRSPEVARRMMAAGFFEAIEDAPQKSGAESKALGSGDDAPALPSGDERAAERAEPQEEDRRRQGSQPKANLT